MIAGMLITAVEFKRPPAMKRIFSRAHQTKLSLL
jgi:hypothetical protein